MKPVIYDLHLISLSCTVFPTTDVLDILKPFLDVIKSDKTTGPITGVALSSVYKFLQYGFLGSLHALV
jgi:hypothetical protein